MKHEIIFIFLVLGSTLMAQNENTGIFKPRESFPKNDSPVIAQYDAGKQLFSFQGRHQKDSSGEEGGKRYIFNEVAGDFILTATFHVEDVVDDELQLGLMARASKNEQGSHLYAKIAGDGTAALEWMDLEDENGENETNQISAPKFNYDILQLERSGDFFIMRAAHHGEPLQEIGSRQQKMPERIVLGLFCSVSGAGAKPVAKISNVRLDKPVQEDYDPNRSGYLGSRLETVDVKSGERRIIHVENQRFEAPNWMPHGERLLFNMNGLLYTIPLEGGDPKELDTGFATNNNNDHGISFNGKLLAISHHREGLPGGGSTVYVLPIEGGEPRLVTEETPSYWHGWAPNNREVVYVASREGSSNYNIYKKSIEGGEEVALTNTGELEHVDGPEYSPDGEYIYYNGSASGTMQIWRMKPDGSRKEQVTFDAENDWFPHISPDGKWIAYISFPPYIPVNDHPSYKRVTLKLIPAAGGAPKVIAYLYGGQGTINVPSWSPDSRYISFVSNF